MDSWTVTFVWIDKTTSTPAVFYSYKAAIDHVTNCHVRHEFGTVISGVNIAFKRDYNYLLARIRYGRSGKTRRRRGCE